MLLKDKNQSAADRKADAAAQAALDKKDGIS